MDRHQPKISGAALLEDERRYQAPKLLPLIQRQGDVACNEYIQAEPSRFPILNNYGWPQEGPIATVVRRLLVAIFEILHRDYLPFVTIVDPSAIALR